ncbi:hypothetical protein NpPPO83_00001728 [Neofusicoccum parvum]|uniref:Uncharacterized protein n=1 Tax=Neofusicoccum parvum TaxID=310453 RepID=A0ACB5RX69_9PEZI|nr:hypothetical protein NpPPO83_00001728 [Neofusicoccum parvum]
MPRSPNRQQEATTTSHHGSRRKVGKLCFYCGQDDHFVRDCPEEHRKHERKRREWILVTGEEPVEKDLARAAAKAKAKYRGRLMQGAPGV